MNQHNKEIKDIITSSVDTLTNAKIKRKIFPTHVTKVELFSYINTIFKRNLKELIDSNELESGNMINGEWIKLTSYDNN